MLFLAWLTQHRHVVFFVSDRVCTRGSERDGEWRIAFSWLILATFLLTCSSQRSDTRDSISEEVRVLPGLSSRSMLEAVDELISVAPP